MTIKRKIWVSFSVVIALVFLMSFFTYIKVSEINLLFQETLTQSLRDIELAEELSIDVANEAVAMRRFNFSGVLADVAEFENHRKFGDSKISQLEEVMKSQEAVALLQEIKKEKAAFDDLAMKSIQARRAEQLDQMALLMKEAGKPSENTIAATKAFITIVKSKTRERQEQSVKDGQEIKVLLILASLLLAAISIFVSVYLSRNISKPIHEVAKAAGAFAGGDLSIDDIAVRTRDEAGQLAIAFNRMKARLRELIYTMAESAEQVAASSEELTASAEQSARSAGQTAVATGNVAQGAADQMTAVDQAVLAVQQISAGIQQIAVNANTVTDKSAQAAQTAQTGHQAVGKAVAQMTQIEQSVNVSADVVAKLGERSQEIGLIVETISGIAAQTNLLALNAAIEAARAGEQGKGFAVVADEVRKLAEQSQSATKKIAALVSGIQGETKKAVGAMITGTQEARTGVQVVSDAGQAFRGIEQLVQEVTGQIREISAAISHLANGSEQVVAAVKEIELLSQKVSAETQHVSAGTQEQSASSQEIAASCQDLADMAQKLRQEVSKFSL